MIFANIVNNSKPLLLGSIQIDILWQELIELFRLVYALLDGSLETHLRRCNIYQHSKVGNLVFSSLSIKQRWGDK